MAPKLEFHGGRYGAAPALYELAVDAKKYGAYSDAPGAPVAQRDEVGAQPRDARAGLVDAVDLETSVRHGVRRGPVPES